MRRFHTILFAFNRPSTGTMTGLSPSQQFSIGRIAAVPLSRSEPGTILAYDYRDQKPMYEFLYDKKHPERRAKLQTNVRVSFLAVPQSVGGRLVAQQIRRLSRGTLTWSGEKYYPGTRPNRDDYQDVRIIQEGDGQEYRIARTTWATVRNEHEEVKDVEFYFYAARLGETPMAEHLMPVSHYPQEVVPTSKPIVEGVAGPPRETRRIPRQPAKPNGSTRKSDSRSRSPRSHSSSTLRQRSPFPDGTGDPVFDANLRRTLLAFLAEEV